MSAIREDQRATNWASKTATDASMTGQCRLGARRNYHGFWSKNDAHQNQSRSFAQSQSLKPDADKARVALIERKIVTWHRSNEQSRRHETIPGIGPITASAIAATITEASLFRSGRELAAWIGLVPRQNSSCGKERLGHISKNGDPYIRRLLVIGAHAVLRLARNGKATMKLAAALLARKP